MRGRLLACATLAVVLAASCSVAVHPIAPPPGEMLTGVYEPYSPGSFGQVKQFASATGQWPSLLVYYSSWGQPFATQFARQAASHGAQVLVQVDPKGVSLSSIADGAQDGYLRQFADAVKQSGHRVVISFAQEMNGPWYPWGTGHVQPAQYIAAWRHVVDVFRSDGASNVTWLWDVNCAFPGSSPVADWWPGSAYVTWAGVDCYFARPSDTFASLFGPIITSVRQVTGKPVLVAETATGPGSGAQRQEQIREIFTGVKAYGLLGFAWFDESQNDGPYHQDWRLEDDPAALAAFRKAEKEYVK